MQTTRYILRQDVPFSIVPPGAPVSVGWLMAALLPFICGLVAVPLLLLPIVLVAFVPVTVASVAKIIDAITLTGWGKKPQWLPVLTFSLLLTPVWALVFTWAALLQGTLGMFGVFMAVNSARSLREGFLYILAMAYKAEYGLNRFSFARGEKERVHWASMYPALWSWYAKPYMSPSEYDGGGDSAIPFSIGEEGGGKQKRKWSHIVILLC